MFRKKLFTNYKYIDLSKNYFIKYIEFISKY